MTDGELRFRARWAWRFGVEEELWRMTVEACRRGIRIDSTALSGAST